MKPYRLIIVIIIVGLLQVGFLPAWRPFGVVPDLLLATIVALGLLTTASETLICAMVVGFALDLSSATDFGERLGFYTVAALAIGLLNRLGFVIDAAIWRFGLAIGLVVVANMIAVLSLFVHGVRLPIGLVVGKTLLAIVFELILVTAVAPIIRRLTSHTESFTVGGHL